MRRRLALALLAFVALWPFATLWLQARWDVDPWKLMSFGMYAAPARRVEDIRVELWVLQGGAWEVATPPADATLQYRTWRRTLGRLAPAEPLARAVFAQTQASAARIEVSEVRLDAASSRVVLQHDRIELKPGP